MPEDLENPEDDQHPDGPKALREALKRAEDKAQAAEARAEKLEREGAFAKAGVDLTNPLHAAAVKGYDGPVEGISEWVGGLGLNAAPAPPAVPAEEREALQRIAAASAGDMPGIPPDEEAEKNREMQEITDRSVREQWTSTRYHDEMRAASQKYGMPIATLPVEQMHGVTR